MPPKKRAADTDASGDESRAAKVAKTSTPKKPASKAKASPKDKAKKAPAKRGAAAQKSPVTPEEFKRSALPLHVDFTHTPPSIETEEKAEAEGKSVVEAGMIGSVTMLPATFSSGTLGWKATKHLAIELTDPETGKKTKVNVQVQINALVKGSKPEAGGKDAEDDEEAEEAAAAEAAVEGDAEEDDE